MLIDRIEIHLQSTLKKYVEHVNSMSDESQELSQSIRRRDKKCT